MSTNAVSPTSTSSSVTSPGYSPTSVYSSPTAVSSTSTPVYVNPAERFNTSPSAPLVKPQSTASQVSQTLNANSSEPFLKISTPSGVAIYAEYGKVVSSTQFSSDLAAANATETVNYIPATGAVRSIQNTLYNQGATVGPQYSTSPQEYASELNFQQRADLANSVPTNRGAVLSLQNTLYNQGAIIGPQYSTTPNQLIALQKQQTPSSGISISGPGGSVLNDIVNAAGYGGFFLSLAPREAYSLITTGKSTYIPLPSQSEVYSAGSFGLLSGAAVGVGFVAAPLEAAVIPALGLSGSGAALAGLGIQAGLGAGYGGISSFVTGGNPVTGAALGALIFPASGLGLKGVGLALPALKGVAAGSDLYQSLFRSVDFGPLTEAGGRVSSAVSGYVSGSDVLQSLFRSPDVSTASRDAYAIRYAVTSIPRQVSGAVASSDFLQSILRTPDTSVAREGISGIGASVKGAASGSDFLQSLVRSPDVPTSASVKLSASQYYYQNLLGRSVPPLSSLSEEGSIETAQVGGYSNFELAQGVKTEVNTRLPGRVPALSDNAIDSSLTAPESSVEILGEEGVGSPLGIGATREEENIALSANAPAFRSPAQDLIGIQFGAKTSVPFVDFLRGIGEYSSDEAPGTLREVLPQGPVGTEMGQYVPEGYAISGPSQEGVEGELDFTRNPSIEQEPNGLLSGNDLGYLSVATRGAGPYGFEDIPELLSGRNVEQAVAGIAGREAVDQATLGGVEPTEFTTSGSADTYSENATQRAIDRILSEDAETTSTSGRLSPYASNVVGRGLIDYRVPDFGAQSYLSPKAFDLDEAAFYEFDEPSSVAEKTTPTSKPPTPGQSYAENIARTVPEPRARLFYDETTYNRTPPGYIFAQGPTASSSLSSLRGLGLLGTVGIRTGALTSYSLMQSQNQISSLSLASILQNLSVTAQSQSIVQSSIQAQIQSQSLIQLQAQSTVTETITETTLLTQLDFRFPDVLSPVYPPFVSLDNLAKRQKRVIRKKGYRPTHERNRVAMEIGSSFGDFAAALEQSDIFGSTGYFSTGRKRKR